MKALLSGYGIKVKGDKVLVKDLLRHRFYCRLGSAKASVEYWSYPSAPHLLLMNSSGVPYVYHIDNDAESITRAKAWAQKFNELADTA